MLTKTKTVFAITERLARGIQPPGEILRMPTTMVYAITARVQAKEKANVVVKNNKVAETEVVINNCMFNC
jgi:hypothetical protein